MNSSDSLDNMITNLEQYRYSYTTYLHANGCGSINSDILLNQLKLNEHEIRASAVNELREKLSARMSETSSKVVVDGGLSVDMLPLDQVLEIIMDESAPCIESASFKETEPSNEDSSKSIFDDVLDIITDRLVSYFVDVYGLHEETAIREIAQQVRESLPDDDDIQEGV